MLQGHECTNTQTIGQQTGATCELTYNQIAFTALCVSVFVCFIGLRITDAGQIVRSAERKIAVPSLVF